MGLEEDEFIMQRLRLLLNNMLDMVSITNPDGTIQYISPSIINILGYKPEKLVGHSFADIIHPMDLKAAATAFSTAVESTIQTRAETRCRHADGHYLWLDSVVNPVMDDNGVVEAIVIASRDITARKQAEQYLRDERQKLYSLLDNLPAFVYLQNVDYSIGYYNQNFRQLFGRPAGRPCFDVVNGFEQPCKNCPSFRVFETNSPEMWEWSSRDDKIYQMYAYPFSDIDGTPLVLGLGIDITDRKQAEKELSLSQERFYKAFNASPNPMAITKLDGTYVEINNSFAQVVGYQREEVIGRTSNDLNIIEKNIEALQMLQDLGTLRNYEAYIRTKSGDMRFGTFAADTIVIEDVKYLLTIFTDITQRKQVEEELYRREQFLNSVFESIQDRLTVIDTEFNIIRTNKKVEEGYAQELPLAGKKCYQAYHGKNEICAGCPCLQTISTCEPAHAIVAIKDPGGKHSIYIDHYCYPFIDLTTGKLAGVIIYARDITEKLRLERKLAHMERLHLIAQMAAGIGHEIRNPMTTVRGFLQLLSGKEECFKYKEYYDLMIDELDRANDIISEFLSLAKNKAVDSQKQNLNRIIRSIYPLITADAMVHDKYVILELEAIPDLLLDEKEIRQLLLNLTRNGLEAMASGRNLTIKTYQDGPEVVLAVQDQGSGIESSLLVKLGTPFFTTKDNGTGLGLAVCYNIVASHNATINIDTGPEGTTFFIRFHIEPLLETFRDADE